ncbi:cobyrinate a,c-diamide synthase [Calothrix sp. UHCC 0171]|uniref:cobyrinate a,c-diamide synthase n=1 Tax=Calothrix sp. UHCC 0171 TaxID=3110245 RepID=UPI002B1F3175|nr:cobyrinate a,c-diamide synthase [Calothrix sp. UHCC 0171]MEA5574131.1 cobyrinate a,c-diamide synthase [Calothrix sp. UHCC 0171]
MPLIIAGTSSGVGKTTVTLALLAYLCQKKLRVQSFKVGPDYIDPMFHRYVTGRACRNLDPVLTSEDFVQECFAGQTQEVDFALVEGVMGLFDGVGVERGFPTSLPSFASTAHIAKLLKIPVLLVIDCSRLSGSVAAIAHGYSTLDPHLKIAGLVLNRVGSDRHLELLKNALEALQISVFGVLWREDNISIPDRHLGLIPTEELPELDSIISRLAALGKSCFDWERLLPLLQIGEERGCGNTGVNEDKEEISPYLRVYPVSNTRIRIAIAFDKAFNFYYQDNLDLLEKLGAELVFWSPLVDTNLPENIQGMYFGGGFPEMFAEQLANNTSGINSVKNAILAGMPTIAECGGLMYLCDRMIDFAETAYPMLGILPAIATMDQRLTLGYRRAVALQDGLLVPANTVIYGHEFHRSRLLLNPEFSSTKLLFTTSRYDTDEFTGYEGWNILPNLHASYIHLHWGGNLEIPQRFVEHCHQFREVFNHA